jgi:hypothetical protein
MPTTTQLRGRAQRLEREMAAGVSPERETAIERELQKVYATKPTADSKPATTAAAPSSRRAAPAGGRRRPATSTPAKHSQASPKPKPSKRRRTLDAGRSAGSHISKASNDLADALPTPSLSPLSPTLPGAGGLGAGLVKFLAAGVGLSLLVLFLSSSGRARRGRAPAELLSTGLTSAIATLVSATGDPLNPGRARRAAAVTPVAQVNAASAGVVALDSAAPIVSAVTPSTVHAARGRIRHTRRPASVLIRRTP